MKGIVLMFLCMLGVFQGLSAEEDPCHVVLVQVPTGKLVDLNDEEIAKVLDLAQKFTCKDISVIYSSDDPCALQTADLIAEYHDLSVAMHPTLRAIIPNTLFQRVGGIRNFAADLVEQNKGRTAILVTHESLILFIGRYLKGGFKKIPNFSYIEVYGDGKSPLLAG